MKTPGKPEYKQFRKGLTRREEKGEREEVPQAGSLVGTVPPVVGEILRPDTGYNFVRRISDELLARVAIT